jgi:hypothetical protein
MLIIGLYVLTYMRLSHFYTNMRFVHAKYLSTYDQEQITKTLRTVAVFFVAIIQCVIYRIFQRVLVDFFAGNFIDEDLGEPTELFQVLVSLFYISETLMIVGMCISIRQSIMTAKESKDNYSYNGMKLSKSQICRTDNEFQTGSRTIDDNQTCQFRDSSEVSCNQPKVMNITFDHEFEERNMDLSQTFHQNDPSVYFATQ